MVNLVIGNFILKETVSSSTTTLIVKDKTEYIDCLLRIKTNPLLTEYNEIVLIHENSIIEKKIFLEFEILLTLLIRLFKLRISLNIKIELNIYLPEYLFYIQNLYINLFKIEEIEYKVIVNPINKSNNDLNNSNNEISYLSNCNLHTNQILNNNINHNIFCMDNNISSLLVNNDFNKYNNGLSNVNSFSEEKKINEKIFMSLIHIINLNKAYLTINKLRILIIHPYLNNNSHDTPNLNSVNQTNDDNDLLNLKKELSYLINFCQLKFTFSIKIMNEGSFISDTSIDKDIEMYLISNKNKYLSIASNNQININFSHIINTCLNLEYAFDYTLGMYIKKYKNKLNLYNIEFYSKFKYSSTIYNAINRNDNDKNKDKKLIISNSNSNIDYDYVELKKLYSQFENSELEKYILFIKYFSIIKPNTFHTLTNSLINVNNLRKSIERLFVYNLIDSNYSLTNLGEEVSYLYLFYNINLNESLSICLSESDLIRNLFLLKSYISSHICSIYKDFSLKNKVKRKNFAYLNGDSFINLNIYELYKYANEKNKKSIHNEFNLNRGIYSNAILNEKDYIDKMNLIIENIRKKNMIIENKDSKITNSTISSSNIGYSLNKVLIKSNLYNIAKRSSYEINSNDKNNNIKHIIYEILHSGILIKLHNSSILNINPSDYIVIEKLICINNEVFILSAVEIESQIILKESNLFYIEDNNHINKSEIDYNINLFTESNISKDTSDNKIIDYLNKENNKILFENKSNILSNKNIQIQDDEYLINNIKYYQDNKKTIDDDNQVCKDNIVVFNKEKDFLKNKIGKNKIEINDW